MLLVINFKVISEEIKVTIPNKKIITLYLKQFILSLDFTDIFEEINRQSAREEIGETINAVYLHRKKRTNQGDLKKRLGQMAPKTKSLFI